MIRYFDCSSNCRGNPPTQPPPWNKTIAGRVSPSLASRGLVNANLQFAIPHRLIDLRVHGVGGRSSGAGAPDPPISITAAHTVPRLVIDLLKLDAMRGRPTSRVAFIVEGAAGATGS